MGARGWASTSSSDLLLLMADASPWTLPLARGPPSLSSCQSISPWKTAASPSPCAIRQSPVQQRAPACPLRQQGPHLMWCDARLPALICFLFCILGVLIRTFLCKVGQPLPVRVGQLQDSSKCTACSASFAMPSSLPATCAICRFDQCTQQSMTYQPCIGTMVRPFSKHIQAWLQAWHHD